MKIAYIGLHLEEKIMLGGVGQKIQTQMKLWKEFGHSTHCFLLTPDTIQIDNISSFKFSKVNKQGVFGLLKQEIARSSCLKDMIRAVKDYRPNVIYLRYGLYTIPLKRLFSIAPVIVEINSNDVEEYKYRGLFYYWMNRLTRGIQLKNASGMVAMSQELADLGTIKKYKKPILIIANGIDFNEVEPISTPDNQIPHIIFVGTPGYQWHGVDKVKRFAERYSDLIIDLVGYSDNDFDRDKPSNLICHGFLPKGQIPRIMQTADAAFGTLALHRKNMIEASPLKVREALAYGIPVVIGYQDTDLDDLDVDFILKIPNEENNLSEYGERIHDFVYKMRGQRADHEILYKRLDQGLKEKKKIVFFESFCK